MWRINVIIINITSNKILTEVQEVNKIYRNTANLVPIHNDMWVGHNSTNSHTEWLCPKAGAKSLLTEVVPFVLRCVLSVPDFNVIIFIIITRV